MIRIFFALFVVFSLFLGWNLFLQKKPEKRTWLRSSQKMVMTYRPFVILIPSYNNFYFYKKNLRSVFEQKYPNYRVIYIDDASTDGTDEGVSEWLQNEMVAEKVKLIHNTTQLGALANVYHAIQSCENHEILVFLDGDDWLAHDEVLLWLNQVYEDPDVWMTYGSYVQYPSYRRGKGKKILEKIYTARNHRVASEEDVFISHLKSAYATLLKRVQKKDLMEEGKFFPMCFDLALFYPAIEMAGRHAHYIRDVLYIYNRENLLNDDKKDLKMQQYYRKLIENLPRYPLLTKLEDDLQSAHDEKMDSFCSNL